MKHLKVMHVAGIGIFNLMLMFVNAWSFFNNDDLFLQAVCITAFGLSTGIVLLTGSIFVRRVFIDKEPLE